MDWLEPWVAVGGNEKQRLTQQLLSEVGAGHLPNNVTAIVVGRSLANDDVLVQLQQHENQYAVVHLAWQPSRGAAWPHIIFYADWDVFVNHRMSFDNQGY
jgi:hypothetical protein